MTVAEVILALFVITVGLLGLLAAMPLSLSQIAEANLKTTAAFLAQQRLEQIKNAQWTTVADTVGGGGSDGTAAVAVAGFPDRWPDEAVVASYPQFQRRVRIRDCSVAACGIALDPSLATLRQVTVAVSFARMTGLGMLDSATPESVQLVTYVARQD
jgi:Tfp pilus assembly protein PilV